MDEDTEYSAFYAGVRAAEDEGNAQIRGTDGFFLGMDDHTIRSCYEEWVKRGRRGA